MRQIGPTDFDSPSIREDHGDGTIPALSQCRGL
jgi:hypothetical protein